MNQAPIGRAWVEDQWKYIYAIREITRGKRKGWMECTFITSSMTGPVFRKRQIKDGVRLFA